MCGTGCSSRPLGGKGGRGTSWEHTGEILFQTAVVIGAAAAVGFSCTLGWPPALRTELGPVGSVFPVVVSEVCATTPATTPRVRSALSQLSSILYLKLLL